MPTVNALLHRGIQREGGGGGGRYGRSYYILQKQATFTTAIEKFCARACLLILSTSFRSKYLSSCSIVACDTAELMLRNDKLIMFRGKHFVRENYSAVHNYRPTLIRSKLSLSLSLFYLLPYFSSTIDAVKMKFGYVR